MDILEKIHFISKDGNNSEVVEEIQNYYKELKNSGRWSIMDAKLFDYLDEDLKKKLKQIERI